MRTTIATPSIAAILIALLSTGCNTSSDTPRIYPVAFEILLETGDVYSSCAREAAMWAQVSTARIDSAKETAGSPFCLIPVGDDEVFVLSTIICTRAANLTTDRVDIEFQLAAAGGYAGMVATPTVSLTREAPTATVSFGSGLRLGEHLTGQVDSPAGAAHCTFSGYYTSDDEIAERRNAAD